MKTPRLTAPQTLGLLLGGGALTLAACGSGNAGSTAGAPTTTPTSPSNSGIVSMTTVNGTPTLADASGHTLYSTSSESGGHILCVGDCTGIWQPVMATQQQARKDTATLHTTFVVVSRPGGGTQLAYHGLPLYTFTPEGAHQLSGNGASDSFNGTQFTWASALTPASASSTPTPSSGGSTSGGGGHGY